MRLGKKANPVDWVGQVQQGKCDLKLVAAPHDILLSGFTLSFNEG